MLGFHFCGIEKSLFAENAAADDGIDDVDIVSDT